MLLSALDDRKNLSGQTPLPVMKIQAGTFRMFQVSGDGDRGSYALAQHKPRHSATVNGV